MLNFSQLKNRLLTKTSAAYPGLETGEAVYVVGDIHGRLDCLALAFATIDRDRQNRSASITTEVFLGDYIDRGPASRGVVDALIARSRTVDAIFLRGNHETMFEDFLEGRLGWDAWRTLGGAETLASYGVDVRRLSEADSLTGAACRAWIPAEHRSFLSGLKAYYTVGPYCFVHAGLRPHVALARQTLGDLTGIRGAFLNYTGDFGYTVIHGHTPVPTVDFRKNRINIDTGAYLTNRLSVLKIDEAGPVLLDRGDS